MSTKENNEKKTASVSSYKEAMVRGMLKGVMNAMPDGEYLKSPFYHLLKQQEDPNYEIPKGIKGIQYDSPEENQAETEWQINLPMAPNVPKQSDTEE